MTEIIPVFERKIGEDEAKELFKSEFWKTMSYREKAFFQFFTKRLCMPFDIFHEAIEKTLGRPVYTHELGLNYEGLKQELLGQSEKPTLQEIIDLIPKEKRIIISC